MVEMNAQAGLASCGTYELRDSTCEKCLVKLEHVEKEGEKVILRCPTCGGNTGRLKQTGVLKPKEVNGEPQ